MDRRPREVSKSTNGLLDRVGAQLDARAKRFGSCGSIRSEKKLALLFLLRGFCRFLRFCFGLGFRFRLGSRLLRGFLGWGRFLGRSLGSGLRRRLGRSGLGGFGSRGFGGIFVALLVAADDQFLFLGLDDIFAAEFVVFLQPGQFVFFEVVFLEIHSILPRGNPARGIASGGGRRRESGGGGRGGGGG